jgi:hypothetical protein
MHLHYCQLLQIPVPGPQSLPVLLLLLPLRCSWHQCLLQHQQQ